MKLCKDCKHLIRDPSVFLKFSRCSMTKRMVPEYRVTGDGDEFRYDYCSTARIGTSDATNCGVDAAWFEPILKEVA